jgi:hypothetical protein
VPTTNATVRSAQAYVRRDSAVRAYSVVPKATRVSAARGSMRWPGIERIGGVDAVVIGSFACHRGGGMSYQLRVARPVRDMARTRSMYCEGFGLRVLAAFEDHHGFDGIILGSPEANYHFEFTCGHIWRACLGNDPERKVFSFVHWDLYPRSSCVDHVEFFLVCLAISMLCWRWKADALKARRTALRLRILLCRSGAPRSRDDERGLRPSVLLSALNRAFHAWQVTSLVIAAVFLYFRLSTGV